MFRNGFLWRFLLALVLLAVIASGGVALYRIGWAQGYQAGALSVNAPGAAQGAAPQAPGPYYGYPYHYGPGFGFPFFFFPFGPLLGIGFFLLVIFLIRGIFRPLGWRRWGYGPYGPHGPWGYGPYGPRPGEEGQPQQPAQGEEPGQKQP